MRSDVTVLKSQLNKSQLAKKKMYFSGLLFFLSILEAGASAVAPVGLGPISLVYVTQCYIFLNVKIISSFFVLKKYLYKK